jgi:NTE family protein
LPTASVFHREIEALRPSNSIRNAVHSIHDRECHLEKREMRKKPTLGLVLSGGGARGIAHIGVIDALRSHGLEPDFIAASSSGAIIGALTAAGHSTETMLEFFHKASPFRLSVDTVRKAGILDTTKVVASFRENFPENSF